MTRAEWAVGCPCTFPDPTAYYVPAHINASFEILNALLATSERVQVGGSSCAQGRLVVPDLCRPRCTT